MDCSFQSTFFFFICILLYPSLALPVCQNMMDTDKLTLLQTQGMQIAYSSYIKGFNLTYETVNFPSDGSVTLHNPLKTLNKTDLPCYRILTFSPNILVTSIEAERNGKWSEQIVVALADDSIMCLNFGIISNQEISFTTFKVIEQLQSNRCFTVAKIHTGDWAIHCENQIHQIVYFQNSQSVRTKIQYFNINDTVIKSYIYNDIVDNKDVSRILIMTPSFISIYKFSSNEVVELFRYGQDFFKVDGLNLTDFVLLDKLVVSDYVRGFFRMQLNNDTITQLQYVSSNGSLANKISGIGSTYFILSDHQIFEILWLQTFTSVNVYQIEGTMSNVLSLKANYQLIIIESEQYIYLHRRQQTNSSYLLQKIQNSGLRGVYLNPQYNTLFEIHQFQITCKLIRQGYISVQNLTSNITFLFVAVSQDLVQLKCSVYISLTLCEDLSKIYSTDKVLQNQFHIPSNTTLTIPIGIYYTGLNLVYNAYNTSQLIYQFKVRDSLKLFSAYANYEVLDLISIDGLNFYKISREQNTYYIEHCSESNMVCQPISHRTIDGNVTEFKIFKLSSNSFYFNIITYMLGNQSNNIYIQRLNLNVEVVIFPTFKLTGEYEQIFDYTLSGQFLFVIHKKLNIVNVFELDFKDYPFIQTIDNSILQNKLFKPLEVRIKPLVSRNLFIKTVDSIFIIDFSPKNTRLLSVIETNITLRSQWHKWDFEFNHKVVNIIYSFVNKIEQYSIIQPQVPLFLKNLPLLDLQITDPIVSYMSPIDRLFVSTKQGVSNHLTVFKVGEPSIQSLFFTNKIGVYDQLTNIKGLKLEIDNLLIFYQNSSHHIWSERIRPEVTLCLSSNIYMSQFITTLPMSIIITSTGDQIIINNSLKIVNYQQKLSTLPWGEQINLPQQASDLILSFDESHWFKGPISKVHVISDGSWSDNITLIHQFQKIRQQQNIVNFKDIIQDNNSFWILTCNQTLIQLDLDFKPMRKMIPGIPSFCNNFTKQNQRIFIFCYDKDKNTSFILPITLSGSDVYNKGKQIPFRNWKPKNIQKTMIIYDWLIILDNDLFAQGQGIIYIYQISGNNSEIILRQTKLLTPQSFNMTIQNSTINDFEVLSVDENSIEIYFTVSKFGIVSGRIKVGGDFFINWTKIDLIQEPPDYMQKYQIDGNQVLQVRIIDSYERFQQRSSLLYRVVIITTKTGANLQLQLSFNYDYSYQTMTFIGSSLIQAFNTYYNQIKLNWLIAPKFDNQSQNLFLAAYFNSTFSTTTIAMYRIRSVRTIENPKFITFKQGLVFQCYIPAKIANALAITPTRQLVLSWIPICNDAFLDANYSLVLYQLSNNISIKMSYNSPPTKLTELRFHASNDYSDATYNMIIKFITKDQMSWWQILLICSSVVLFIVILFWGIRCLRIRKQKKSDEAMKSLLSQARESYGKQSDKQQNILRQNNTSMDDSIQEEVYRSVKNEDFNTLLQMDD